MTVPNLAPIADVLNNLAFVGVIDVVTAFCLLCLSIFIIRLAGSQEEKERLRLLVLAFLHHLSEARNVFKADVTDKHKIRKIFLQLNYTYIHFQSIM